MTAPRRTCVGCRAVRPQAALVRIAAGPVGLAVAPRRWGGRSAYVCPSPACLERALARQALARALRVTGGAVDAAALRAGLAAATARTERPAGGRGVATAAPAGGL